MKSINFLYIIGILFMGLVVSSCDSSADPFDSSEESNEPFEPSEPFEPVEDNTALVPRMIVTEAVLNAEPWYDYTYTTTVSYDEVKRPLIISHTTHRMDTRTKKEETVFVNKIELTYPDAQTIRTVNTSQRLSEDGTETLNDSNVYEYLSAKSGDQILVTILKNGEEDGTIKEDQKDRIILWESSYLSGSTEEKYLFSIQHTYDEEGNIVEAVSVYGGYIQKQRHGMVKSNGIYKNVNIPLWFLVSQFYGAQAPDEHSFHNVAKILSSVGEKDNYRTYGTNEYEYNSNGYPVKKVFKPAPDLLGIWGNSSIIEYQLVE